MQLADAGYKPKVEGHTQRLRELVEQPAHQERGIGQVQGQLTMDVHQHCHRSLR